MATAECVAAPHGLSVIPDESLKEADFGEWEGHTYEEITTKWPGELEAVYASDGSLPARGGESFCQVRDRILKGTRDILSKHKDGDSVFIVSHGAALRCLLFGLLGSICVASGASSSSIRPLMSWNITATATS